MGVSRATWLSRGLDLPHRGSAKDMVLRELLTREQAAKAAEVSLMVRFIGLLAGVERKNVDVALQLYFNELTHTKYGPSGTELTQALIASLKKPPEDDPDVKKRVAAVAALSVDDE